MHGVGEGDNSLIIAIAWCIGMEGYDGWSLLSLKSLCRYNISLYIRISKVTV